MTRWQTFWLMHNGIVDTRKAGLHQATDLLHLPWDDEAVAADQQPTDEEIAAIRQRLQALNQSHRTK